MNRMISALALSLPMLSTPDLIAVEQDRGASSATATATSQHFFERLDVNKDGKVTFAEVPVEGKMLAEFLLRQAGKTKNDSLSRQEFARLISLLSTRSSRRRADEEAIKSALADGEAQRTPENCPACAMGLTAEFVFNRLDVNKDKLVTAAEFRRSPGMDDETKAREVVGRIDKSGDGKLSRDELETVFTARHAKCKKPDPAKLARDGDGTRPDGRGGVSRFARVFILRSDKNGDGKIDKSEFRGGAGGFQRLDKNKNGFIEVDELGELHQRRLDDPKSMKQRLEEGDARRKPQAREPEGSTKIEKKEP